MNQETNNLRQASQSRSHSAANPNCSQQLTTPLHSDTTSQREGDPVRVASQITPLALKATMTSPSQNMPRAFLKSFLYEALIWVILVWSSISVSRLVSTAILWGIEAGGLSGADLILAAFNSASALMTVMMIWVTLGSRSLKISMPGESATAQQGSAI